MVARLLLLMTTVSGSHANQPISQEMGDMAKVTVTLVVKGVMCLTPSLVVNIPLSGTGSMEQSD